MGFPVFGQPFGSRLARIFGHGGGSLTPAQIFNAYVGTLSPLLELRMNIASGTNIPNQGSLGAAQNGTLTLAAGALAQTSPLGVGEAILWDGADTVINVPNSVSMDGIAKYTWAFLCNPASAGEINNARLYNWGNSVSEGNVNINKAVNAGQSAAVMATSLASGVNFLTFGAWQWVFIQYDDTTDRKLHLFKGFGGVVTEAGYTTQTAATGALNVTTFNLFIGNRQLLDTTFAGLFSRVLFNNSILTAAQLLQLTKLAGV